MYVLIIKAGLVLSPVSIFETISNKSKSTTLTDDEPLSATSNLLKLSKSGTQPQQSKAREGDIYESYCSIQKAQEILGFTQSIPIETGLSEILEII